MKNECHFHRIGSQQIGVPREFCASRNKINWYGLSLEWQEGRSNLLNRL
jgi:hypothetical protein